MSRKIVYIINHAAFFVSHRLPLAIAAQKAGWEVDLLIGQPGSKVMEALAEAELEKHKIRYKRLTFRTVGVNPFWELIGFLQLVWHVYFLRPDVIHTASPKASLYGGLVSRLCGVSGLVIAISGMGFLFTGTSTGIKRAAMLLYSRLMKVVFSHKNLTVIVQNRDDEERLETAIRTDNTRIVLIPGSGVDLKKFNAVDRSRKAQLVVLPARLLRDKGVVEFVEAARILKDQGCTWRFALVGTADYANPTSISQDQIEEWSKAGYIEWWGHCEDIPGVLAEAEIVCLPSYREGMPKCLLEAAAAGCPVVTTDVTGCREAIIAGKTGELVPVCDEKKLAAALSDLIADDARRRQYGAAGRNLAEQKFGIQAVVNKTLEIYERSCNRDR